MCFKKYRKMLKKLEKIECEICGNKDKEVLHKHHIIERTELDTSNDFLNLVVVCSNCHNKIHFGKIEIIGIFPSTKLPYGRTVVYKIDGKSNIPGIEEPLYKPQIKKRKVYFEE